MITNKEINAVELSPTKRDFYQLWNELLETASKLSERWDPASSTNESDPGIVLLKVLTAVADKLNYTIDKNILEAFMPSATQEAAMRALCEMLGYEMKYYQSAVTEATITYAGDETLGNDKWVKVPKGTYITNVDDDIVYFTLHDLDFRDTITAKSVEIMEGQWELCETDSGCQITIDNLDDEHRFYLPETQIAENGIFVYNYGNYGDVEDGGASTGTFVDNAATEWQKVENLNSHVSGSLVYKFGYDSKNNLPYIQFPEDVATLITDGLLIYYVRTNGINGNVSYRQLNKFQNIDDIDNASSVDIADEDIAVSNKAAATNGRNRETLDDAYTGYKKTIGTFDTLVTCRDYMNKIYMMTETGASSQPLVSNINVTDVRNDINRSYQIVTFNAQGPATETIAACGTDGEELINSFDLVLYPFKALTGLNTINEYKQSFAYSDTNLTDIKTNLDENKTLAHNLMSPNGTDIACVKNMLKLRTTISTFNKVGFIEEKSILSNVYKNIYATFNMRKLDFGEEIPTDAILDCIKKADSRIKDVYSDGPVLYTEVQLVNGNSFKLDFATGTDNAGINDTSNWTPANKAAYNKLVLRNILAGRIPMWNYDSRFKMELGESNYPQSAESPIAPIYEKTGDMREEGGETVITSIKATYEPVLEMAEEGSSAIKPFDLKSNEVVKFRAPNFKTTQTYSAYINYFYDSGTKTADNNANIPATMQLLSIYLSNSNYAGWKAAYEYFKDKTLADSPLKNITAGEVKWAASSYPLFNADDDIVTNTKDLPEATPLTYLACETALHAVYFDTFIKTRNGKDSHLLKGLYTQVRIDMDRAPGELVDANHVIYKKANGFTKLTDKFAGFTKYYVQETHENDSPEQDYTADGLGRGATLNYVPANSEYKLQGDDKLYFNYTKTIKDENGNESSSVINKVYTSEDNVIIRPNFKLKDSHEMNTLEGKRFTKFDGYDFGTATRPAGMFALGSDEQIEIREPVEVYIGCTKEQAEGSATGTDEYVNIYWNRNDDTKNIATTAVQNSELFEVNFTFDEDNDTAYTLKAGEYFYFTDKNKLDIAYYGPGTKIIRSNTTLHLTKYESNNGISPETIAQYGLAASIPWKQYKLNNVKYLKIKEYQYITLTSGDSIQSLILTDASDTEDSECKLTSRYVTVDSASYLIDGEDATGSPTDLPVINIPGSKWEVASFLDINMSPESAQVLETSYDKITLCRETLTWSDEDQRVHETPAEPVSLSSQTFDGVLKPLSIKSNYVMQSATGQIDTTVRKYDSQHQVIEYIDNFAVRPFLQVGANATASNDTELLNLNNFGEHWTKIAFKAADTVIKLPVAAPEGDACLLSFYYIPPETGSGNTLNVSLEGGNSKSLIDLGKDSTSVQTLDISELGLRTLKISSAATAIKFKASAGQLIVGSLNLIDDTDPVNKAIHYFPIDANTTAINQLLADIENAVGDKSFYYDVPMNNATAIDMYVVDDMQDPRVWYDVNNINNNFVISEIDSDFLESGNGVTIAGTCKK